MSDDFDDLNKLADALKAATPTPDDARKSDTIAAAMKNFEQIQKNFQGSEGDARLTPEATQKGTFFQGVIRMLDTLTSRAAMATTTALVAVGFTFFVIMPQMNGTTDLTGAGADFTLTDDAIPAPVVELAEEVAVSPSAVLKAAEADMARPEPSPEPGLETGRGRDMAAAETESLLAPPPAPAPQVGGRLVLQGTAGMAAAPNADGFRADLAQNGAFVSGEEMVMDIVQPEEPDTETFANEAPNPLKITTEEPVSTFSIDVDTAAYSVVRSSLMRGMLPPSDAVRIEEMINYFPYDYATPEGEHPFEPTVTLMDTPWNDGTQLVHIAIQGELPAMEDRPALNLVFLIDTSGSMNSANKLPLLKQSFRLMLSQLRPEDQVSIVAYAGSSGLVLEPTFANETSIILAALNQLDAGGGTAGQAGLQQAYSVAEAMSEDGEVSRIILATDGDFNVGIYDPDELKDYISEKRDTGVYLSVLGFGRGNLDDTTMQALAQNGNGTAAYIDTLSEAQKVLVDQLSGALFPIANDVKIQVEFNPEMIAEYRLIGYETRALAREDFNNDLVDAGEIGAGHSVTAIYEITPVGSDAIMSDALRYQAPVEGSGSNELGFLKLRYKTPGESTSTLIQIPIVPGMGEANTEVQFATAIAGFGQLLNDGKYMGDWTYADAIALAQTNKGDDGFGYRAEAVTLMRLADSLSQD